MTMDELAMVGLEAMIAWAGTVEKNCDNYQL